MTIQSLSSTSPTITAVVTESVSRSVSPDNPAGSAASTFAPVTRLVIDGQNYSIAVPSGAGVSNGGVVTEYANAIDNALIVRAINVDINVPDFDQAIAAASVGLATARAMSDIAFMHGLSN